MVVVVVVVVVVLMTVVVLSYRSEITEGVAVGFSFLGRKNRNISLAIDNPIND